MTCTFGTSLEVEVDVLSEETLTGVRQLTSHAFLTFVSVDASGTRLPVPPLLVETDAERQRCEEAHARRAERLGKRKAEGASKGKMQKAECTMHNAQCRMQTHVAMEVSGRRTLTHPLI